jgi:ubiquinone/menaquinone biosynthesis C-methylase UbiE
MSPPGPGHQRHDHGPGGGHGIGRRLGHAHQEAGLFRHPLQYQRVSGLVAAPMYRRVAREVAAASLPAGARVLDVGTGPGLVPVRIGRRAPHLRVDAVDLSPEMIEQARVNIAAAGLADRVTATVADVADLPFEDGAFDLVVSSISQHHWADPVAGLAEIVRVLRPGAEAWIYDFRRSLPGLLPGLAGLPHVTQTRRLSPIARLVVTARPG